MILFDSTLLVKPVYSMKDDAMGTKLISRYPRNGAKGLPSHMGVIVLFDPVCGAPKAVSIVVGNFWKCHQLLAGGGGEPLTYGAVYI